MFQLPVRLKPPNHHKNKNENAGTDSYTATN